MIQVSGVITTRLSAVSILFLSIDYILTEIGKVSIVILLHPLRHAYWKEYLIDFLSFSNDLQKTSHFHYPKPIIQIIASLFLPPWINDYF